MAHIEGSAKEVRERTVDKAAGTRHTKKKNGGDIVTVKRNGEGGTDWSE